MTGLFVILISMVYKPGIDYLFLLWAILFSTSFFVIPSSYMARIVDYIMGQEFSDSFDFFYKCLIISTSVTIFIALLIILGLYHENLKEAPVSLVIAITFSTTSALLYFFGKKICISKNKEGES